MDIRSFLFKSLNFEWIPQYCQLCGETSHRAICNECEYSLPLITESCITCDLPMRCSGSLCQECITTPPSFSRLYASAIYQAPHAKLISQIKQNRAFQWIRVFTEPLVKRIKNEELSIDALVPVPMFWLKRLTRGYNQAEVIAQVLSKDLHIPVVHVIKKHKHTATQHLLNRKERMKNLSDAFSCKNVEGKSLAIVDDVVTTGATVELLSRLLIAQGAKHVFVMSLARTPKNRSTYT